MASGFYQYPLPGEINDGADELFYCSIGIKNLNNELSRKTQNLNCDWMIIGWTMRPNPQPLPKWEGEQVPRSDGELLLPALGGGWVGVTGTGLFFISGV